MKAKAKSQIKSIIPSLLTGPPIYIGRAICVDFVEMPELNSLHRSRYRFIFETLLDLPEGGRLYARTRKFLPSSFDLRIFLRRWMGEDITGESARDFVGRSGKIVVVHGRKNDLTRATVDSCMP